MLSPASQITTVVDAMPHLFAPAASQTTSYNLYFHIILKINNQLLSKDHRRQLERYIGGFVRTKCDVKSIGRTAKQLNLLIAMPPANAALPLPGELISSKYPWLSDKAQANLREIFIKTWK